METYFAFVLCLGRGSGLEGCGKQGLTREQYDAQMDRPDELWCCPACGAEASFDSGAFDRMHYSVEEVAGEELAF